VQAATILAKLNEQIEQPERIEVIMDSIVIEDVFIDGYLQVAEAGMVGDVHVVVTEDKDTPIEVDVALALSHESSWILLRKLEIGDPDVQPLLTLFFPPGSETLLMLPEDVEIDEFGNLNAELGVELQQIRSLGLIEAFQELIQSQPDVGATITEQSDGTLLLTLPIEDTEAINQLILMAAKFAENTDEIDLEELEAELDSEDPFEDEIGLIGSTISIVYDPETEEVRSFTFSDFGQANGTLSIDIGGGEIDPALFDASRVTTPNTRTFDLGALQSVLEQFEVKLDDI
jgi:hypothetical protein